MYYVVKNDSFYLENINKYPKLYNTKEEAEKRILEEKINLGTYSISRIDAESLNNLHSET